MSRNNRFNNSNVPVRKLISVTSNNYPLMPSEFTLFAEKDAVTIIKEDNDSGINLYLNTNHVFSDVESFMSFVIFNYLLMDGLSVTFYPGNSVLIPDKTSCHSSSVYFFKKYFKSRGLKLRINMNFERGFLGFIFDRSVTFDQHSLVGFLLELYNVVVPPSNEEFERNCEEFEESEESQRNCQGDCQEDDESQCLYGIDEEHLQFQHKKDTEDQKIESSFTFYGNPIIDGENCLMDDFYGDSKALINACLHSQLLPITAGHQKIIFANCTVDLINVASLSEELLKHATYAGGNFNLTLDPLSSDSQYGFKLSIIVF